MTFNEICYVNRKNTNCSKWDGIQLRFGRQDILPVWIADMDFAPPECVRSALKEYVANAIFGYYLPQNSFYDSIINWYKSRHNMLIKREEICFAPSVVSAINWLIHILTKENDNILIQTPVYYPFFEAILNNNRNLVKNELVKEQSTYAIDLDDFEKKIVDNDVKMFILCSPHNPVGRVWNKSELFAMLEICEKNSVIVISDEIHSDIIFENNVHIPSINVAHDKNNIITCLAPHKTFNLAGCKNAQIIIPDCAIREKYNDYVHKNLRIKAGNNFGYVATEAAYKGGEEWLVNCLQTIYKNFTYLKNSLNEALPDIWISELQGTYLAWVDLGKYIREKDMEHFIIDICKFAPDFGNWFGSNNANTFIRINLATDFKNIEFVVNRLIENLK